MDDHAEDGILRSQLAGKDGVQQQRKKSIAYLDDRILTYLVAMLFLGLLVIWATAKSPLVVYGSLVVAILMILFWGYLQIRRIERTREARARQVEAMRTDTGRED